jgi:hypothetical protein
MSLPAKAVAAALMLAALPAVVAAAYAPPSATGEPVSVLANGSFELTEPPPPDAAGGGGPGAPAEAWLARGWSSWCDGPASRAVPDDPAQAHSGRRCALLRASAGGAAHLRYLPLVAPDGRPWRVALWTCGSGRLDLTALDTTADQWRAALGRSFDLGPDWRVCAMDFTPPEGCRQWCLDITVAGPAEARVDDVFAGYAGATPLALPPDGPLARDGDTLLYLPFEEPLDEDAFYVGGDAKLTGPGEGRFGRALALGHDAYVACSANENLDPAGGTIELWFKLLSPGNDSIYRPLVQVPGPEGMSLHKDQYAHVGLFLSTGWQPLSQAVCLGCAYWWQPGIWRHIAACWDADLMEVFVDGRLIAWTTSPKLPHALGPELRIGSPDMLVDDLRISRTVRYRVPVHP